MLPRPPRELPPPPQAPPPRPGCIWLKTKSHVTGSVLRLSWRLPVGREPERRRLLVAGRGRSPETWWTRWTTRRGCTWRSSAVRCATPPAGGWPAPSAFRTAISSTSTAVTVRGTGAATALLFLPGCLLRLRAGGWRLELGGWGPGVDRGIPREEGETENVANLLPGNRVGVGG